MSKDKTNTMNINFVDLSGQTDEESNVTVGVSDRFNTDEFREMTRKRLMSSGSLQKDSSDVSSDETTEAIQETKEKTDKILTNIAGNTGSYAILPLSSLEPTPNEWNQFSPISNEKKVLMADSIYRNGLQQPIVVRAVDEEGKKYQILAGNTRKSIYEVLYDLTKDEKYLSIECKVYGYNELTDDQAMEIASDTNYVQRANLTGRDRSFAIRTKLTILKKRGEKQVLEKVAEQMGMKRTATFCWNKMANLIAAFFDMYDNGLISQNTATRIAAWPHDVQEELYLHRDIITEEIIMSIPAKTPAENIMDSFNNLVEQSNTDKGESNPICNIDSFEEKNRGYSLHISGKIPDGSELIIMHLPEKKAKSFKNRYKNHIIAPYDDI